MAAEHGPEAHRPRRMASLSPAPASATWRAARISRASRSAASRAFTSSSLAATAAVPACTPAIRARAWTPRATVARLRLGPEMRRRASAASLALHDG
jgi:hypothetical protein